MMMMEEEFQECENASLEDCDLSLSLLRLTSPPSSHSHSRSLSTEISPLKRSSPLSDDSESESDQPKRRRLSPQNPIFINSPLRFTTYPQTQSSSIDENIRCSPSSPVPEKQETTPFQSKTPDSEKKQKMKMANDGEEENNDDDPYKEEEEDCGEEGMRIERSGEGFIIRLKCRCKFAFRVLFSDHHLYFKPL